MTLNNNWYFYQPSGAMAISRWEGNYYLKNDGVMAVNEWVDSNKYYVGGDGKWIPDYGVPKWKSDSVGWWFDYGDGTYPKNEWKTIGGIQYYFKSSGYMATGWQKIGSDWYYFDSSGRMLTNQWVDGYYYVGANGVMATNTWIGNYYVDDSGRWTQTRGTTSYNYFIKSKNSNKFHHPNCPEVHNIKESNKQYLYESKAALIARGLKPCSVCANYN